MEGATKDVIFARLIRPLLAIPLFWKVLVANAGVVLLASAAGFLVGAQHGTGPKVEWLVALAAGALVVSVVVNAVIVWVALQPLRALETTAARVGAGEFDARVAGSPLADRNLSRLAATFNAMLDGIAAYRLRLREIAARALGAAEEERKRIARELHDETAQSLAGLMLRVRLARNSGDERLRQRVLDEMREELSVAVERVRSVAQGLRPPALEMLGLAAAVNSHAAMVADTAGIEVDVDIEDIGDALNEEGELALYRIIQAALSNVARHAAATRASVTLRRAGERVQASISDNGNGFDLDAVLAKSGEGLGILGMQERAAYLSGRTEVRSAPGRGTRIEVDIPVAGTVANV